MEYRTPTMKEWLKVGASVEDMLDHYDERPDTQWRLVGITLSGSSTGSNDLP